MEDIKQKLGSMKDATLQQYNEAIDKYSYSQVIKELKNAGLSKDELSSDEFNKLLAAQVKETKSFSNGAMASAGVLLFLDFLG